MSSITVDLFVESRYKINRKKLKTAVANALTEHGLTGPTEISIAIVGDRKMRELSRKYKGEDKTRNILSFSLTEGETVVMPTDVLRLGDIVISYPVVITESARDNMLVDEKIEELALHGLKHLLGIHH